MFKSPVPVRFVALLALLMLLASVSPARAQQSVTLLPEINVFIATDNVNIKIHHKVGPQPIKVPVLLIHGTWGNANTWDFPGRSVMSRVCRTNPIARAVSVVA